MSYAVGHMNQPTDSSMIGNSIIAATGVATGATTSAPGVTPPSNTGNIIDSRNSKLKGQSTYYNLEKLFQIKH